MPQIDRKDSIIIGLHLSWPIFFLFNCHSVERYNSSFAYTVCTYTIVKSTSTVTPFFFSRCLFPLFFLCKHPCRYTWLVRENSFPSAGSICGNYLRVWYYTRNILYSVNLLYALILCTMFYTYVRILRITIIWRDDRFWFTTRAHQR